MGAELLVQVQVRSLTEQVEVELGQNRRKAVRVVDLHFPLAVAGAHPIAAFPVAEPALEQAGGVDALEVAFVAVLVDYRYPFGIGKKDAHHRHVAFEVRAEIAERVGMTALNHRIGLGRKRAHAGASSGCARMRQVPASGTRSQLGRCASSYSIS